MRTAAIVGTAIHPLAGGDVAGLAGVGRVPGQTLGRVAAELRSVPRYVVRYSVVALALLGLLGLWDAHGDSRIPVMIPLMGTQKDPNLFSATDCAEGGVGDDERWEGLSASLAILDDVNPQVADWLRERHNQGGLVFSDQYSCGRDRQTSLARYDHFGGELTLQRALFEENDGEIAAILCHEYRHSRQNVAKLARCVLSFVFAADGDRSILENDAQLYEYEARLAIFRR